MLLPSGDNVVCLICHLWMTPLNMFRNIYVLVIKGLFVISVQFIINYIKYFKTKLMLNSTSLIIERLNRPSFKHLMSAAIFMMKFIYSRVMNKPVLPF